MDKQFDLGRFEAVTGNKVEIDGFRYGHGNLGKLDVWIDSNPQGKRFLSQVTTAGERGAIQTGVYTKECYILRERASGKYYFLDINDTGIWLYDSSFLGAETFALADAGKIRQWLA